MVVGATEVELESAACEHQAVKAHPDELRLAVRIGSRIVDILKAV